MLTEWVRAMQDPNAIEWTKAIEEKLDKLYKNET